MILTYRYRVKDGGASTRRALHRMTGAANYVWNFCCETQREAERRWKAGGKSRWPSYFTLTMLTAGCAADLGLHSRTVRGICRQFCASRDKIKRCPRWRTGRKNLGWIPINDAPARAFKLSNGVLTFLKRKYYLWFSRAIPANATLKTASFACDNRGRWYFNVVLELPDGERKDGPEVGIDLGLKTLATLSDGRKIEPPQYYRKAEEQLAKFQRFGMKKRAQAIAAKVANQRKDFLHKLSTGLVREFAHIVVGDVSPSKLGKTRMAKAIHDAGWSMLRQMLFYKGIALGALVEVVSERMTTQACSCCGSLASSTKPKGIGALGIRHWTCSDCDAAHDRDVNAARNILFAGAERRPLGAGITAVR
jgi:IS605 OrfB family transposase